MSGLAYPFFSYGRMLSDPVRMETYAAALAEVVRPGDLVFDLGAGPGGFAVLACRLGAAKAVAVEVDPSVRLAPDMAAAEGCADRLEIFEGLSTDFAPAERADVIVADLRGSLPLYGKAIPSLIDARDRLLKPGGTMIPLRDRLVIALVRSPRRYRPFARPWPRNRLGLRLDSARRFVVNHYEPCWLTPREIASAPEVIATLDYATIGGPDVDLRFRLTADRAGPVHGYALWYETDLTETIGYSTGPATPSTVYRHLYFPLENPVRLDAGQAVEGGLTARLIGEAYKWHWRTKVRGADGAMIADFRQASDFASLYALDTAALFAEDGKPSRKRDR
jgi:protein arginine N-methyltransferase 1